MAPQQKPLLASACDEKVSKNHSSQIVQAKQLRVHNKKASLRGLILDLDSGRLEALGTSSQKKALAKRIGVVKEEGSKKHCC